MAVGTNHYHIETYSQAESFIMEALPMFQKVGRNAIGEYNLDAISHFLQYLGDPHLRFKSIHVAGTNGKGSVSHMLAAVYQQNGYKTALFTSPHLKTYRERMRINGEYIPEDWVLEWVQTHSMYLREHALSFFEMSMGLACSWFAREAVDIAIMETGLGGRLDATNVLVPLISVITNIGYDHQDILGNSLEEIAREKAGIIKNRVPVVLGNIDSSLVQVFEEKAAQEEALLIQSDAIKVHRAEKLSDGIVYQFDSNTFPASEITLPGLATYQQHNLVTVLHVLDYIKDHIGLEIRGISTLYALEHFISISGLRGRYEIIHRDPLIIADATHNAGGLGFFDHLFKNKDVHLHLVLGMVKGKNLHSILSLLPTHARYYFCAAKVPRAMDAHDLKTEAEKYGLKGEVWPSPAEAIEEIKTNADQHDVGLVLGSIYLIAEIL